MPARRRQPRYQYRISQLRREQGRRGWTGGEWTYGRAGGMWAREQALRRIELVSVANNDNQCPCHVKYSYVEYISLGSRPLDAKECPAMQGILRARGGLEPLDCPAHITHRDLLWSKTGAANGTGRALAGRTPISDQRSRILASEMSLLASSKTWSSLAVVK